jgi:pimeloyl-ACP methyl ester carboxylesterase
MIAIDQTGDGPPLVLLHGVGTSRVIWRRVTPRLARQRLVVAPDLPGFGGSSAAGPGFDLDVATDALAGPLSERAGGPFDLVGNSLGGAVALNLAARHPRLVRRLVLAAPAGFSPWPRPLAFAARAYAGPAVRVRRVLGTPLVGSPIARRALLWGTIAAPARLSTSDARMMLAASRGASRVGDAVGAALRADLSGLLVGIEAPLGLIWGRRDRIIPISTLDTIRAVRPDAAVETLPDAGHVPQLERPGEFVAALCRILRRLE